MTPDERERLATLIAAELERSHGDARRRAPAEDASTPRVSWLPVPVRPEPPVRGGEAPVWSGAGQSLGDVAPVRHPIPSAHRADAAEAAAAVRAAAAGHGSRSRETGSPATQASPPARSARRTVARRASSGDVTVPIGVSRRHAHLSSAHIQALFGSPSLDVHRAIRQPGQFAAVQRVSLVGPKGTIDDLRVVGPARDETQVELALSDAARLGIAPPLASSGSLEGSLGGLLLVGPQGRVTLARGVIVAARHLHLSTVDAERWGMRDGDFVDVRCGSGARTVTWHEVLVRAGPAHATEFHLDEDEARAAGVVTGSVARVVAWRESIPARRILITERDLVARVSRGEPIPPGALLTPGARDRARALDIDVG